MDRLHLDMEKWVPGCPVPYNHGQHLTRHDFPNDFLFGGATSAYQVEGGYEEGRRGRTNWDTWSLLRPGKVSEGCNGCVAIDHYNRFREDVRMMKKMGLDVYRLSIAWSRILPGGTFSSGVNREGVRFYNELIDLLLEEGIEPVVTIFHFDVPQYLEDEYKGFLDPRIVKEYAKYAEVCFFEFGDRVKTWTTINEPTTYTINGYVKGMFPPGHGSTTEELGLDIITHRTVRGLDETLYGPGDAAATEPYLVAHHLILAHAKAVKIYRKKFQAVQGGKIGMVTVPMCWYFPYSHKKEDIEAAERANEFMLGWFIQPLVTGEYPESMQKRVKERLPKFTDKEKRMVTGSYDYIGLNYYSSIWACYKKKQPFDPTNYYTDQEVHFYTTKDGVPIGPQAGSEWLYSVPVGIYALLTYAKKQYNDPLIYITENGADEKNKKDLPLTLLLKDDYRIKYHQEHLAFLKLAIDKDKVNVKGYIVWALFDNFEWAAGYTVRFGMYFVDYANGLARYPKKSAIWYMNFLNKKKLPGPLYREVEEIKEGEKAGKRKRNY